MKISVQITPGIQPLFGTRDENIRVLQNGLKVSTSLLNDSLEIEGDEPNVIRAASILEDYVALVKEGQSFTNGDLNSYLRVVTQDPEGTSMVSQGSVCSRVPTMGPGSKQTDNLKVATCDIM